MNGLAAARSAPGVRQVRRASIALAVRLGVLIVLLSLVGSAVVLLVVSLSQTAARDQLLADTVERVDSVRDAPAGVWVAIGEAGNVTSSPSMPAGLPDQAALHRAMHSDDAVQQTVTVAGKQYVVRTQRTAVGAVQAVFDGQRDADSLARVAIALAVADAVTVLLTAVLAAWFARRALRPVAAALDAQSRFIVDASHELRTPLTVLATRAQLVQREVARTPDAPESLDADARGVVEDAKVLARILDDLLAAADPRGTTPAEEVDLGTLAAEVVAAFAPHAGERGIELVRESEPGMQAALVLGSPVALRRVLTTLIDNSIEFAATRIVVAARLVGGDAVLTVRDDGPGFSPAELGRVFERFARSRAPDASAVHRHYGLGLALAAEIVAQHGGTIGAANPADGTSGAIVTVRLPRATGPR